METLRLLKQEINQTYETEHDFAKWKLIVAASLGAAALGLDKSDGLHQHYWLLFFIPFVCAYIDLHLYQYQDRILVLAQFIRTYSATDPDDLVLQAYETNCENLRRRHLFDLGQYANLYASIILSLVAPGLAVGATWRNPDLSRVEVRWETRVWVAGIALIVILWFLQRRRLKQLDTKIPAAPPKQGESRK